MRIEILLKASQRVLIFINRLFKEDIAVVFYEHKNKNVDYVIKGIGHSHLTVATY